MAKRIVFCSDGTWDDPQNVTNVYTLYKALKLLPGEQQPLYDDGVGADGNPIQRLLGGAFGTGLFQKIKDAYSRIAVSYEQGDEIFLFGFSRGAYTARSLAGLISIAGLPTKPFKNDLVDTAFQAYRERGRRAALLASLAPYGMFDAKIKMIGVWDTVGSLGIPAIIGLDDPLLYGFLDTGLHPDVLNAFQALAIDERRAEFPPTLWSSAPAPGQTIEQMWFAGAHCDVGGSYPETSLSDIALGWMMNKALALGLSFDEGVLAKYSDVDAKHALGTIHESWKPLWGFPKPRSIGQTANVASSVQIRWLADASYRPGNLEA
ncbi:MAG TPA: DUF2235 domain-containing protein, partial [Vicinamibacterales bacterium]|nr:DUF2235 domain-containing protein [Vicinamibacterales bacterium]